MPRKIHRKRAVRRKSRGRKITRRSQLSAKQVGGFMRDGVARMTVNRGLGLPLVLRTKLRYNENVGITSNAGAFGTYQFSCNGLYDPNITGTGHQPMYFDQLTAIYDHYKVVGSKCRVEFYTVSSAAIVPAFCTLFIDDDTSPTTSTSQTIEIGQLHRYVTVGGANRNVTNVCGEKWSCRKYFKDKYQSADLSGSGSANPVEQSYFTLAVQSADGSATLTIFAMVTIDYIVDWYELADTPQS